MRTSNSTKILAGVAIAAVLVASQAQAIIAYQNVAGNYGNQTGGPWVFGSQFTVGTTPINVTALGAFDNNQDGFSYPVNVAIYDFNLQTIVGSTATFSGTAGTIGADGGSRFQTVTPFTLNAGGSYMIVAAGYGGEGGELNYNAGLGSNPYSTVAAGIVGGQAYWALGSTMQFPTAADYAGSPKYAAGTFDFTPVPEVGHFAMAAVGLLGLVYIGRYARNRRTQKLA